MEEMLLNWVVDTFTRVDIIDLYFIVSDLVDIPLTQAELTETAYYDSLASQVAESASNSRNVPIGKLVL